MSPREAPTHAHAFRLRRFANWFPLGLTYASLYMGRYNFNVYRNHAHELHGLTDTQVGTIATVGFYVYATSLLLNGPLAEKLGGRRAILIGVAGAALVNLAIALFLRGPANEGNVVLGLSLLYGANMYFQSFGAISVVKVNSAWFHWRERGVVGGVFGSMISLGYYLALGIGGLVYTRLPFWALFLVPSIVLVAMLAVDSVLVRDRPSDAGLDDFDTGDEPADSATGREEPAVGAVVSRVLKHPVLRVLAVAEFCTGVVRQGLLLHYGRFLAQVHGVSERATPGRYQIASLGITAGGILGALLCGVLSDKAFGSRRAPVAFLFYAMQVVALVALGVASSSYAAVALVGFSCMWIFGVHGMLSGTASMDFGGRRAAATAAGLLDGVQYLGSGLAGLGLGWLLDRYRWTVWPYALVPFSVAGGLLMLRLWNAHPHAPAPATATATATATRRDSAFSGTRARGRT
jgi:OPA family glycerol-3-phosphate transporter-like MFS transporter